MSPAGLRAEDGYELWLRYRPVTDAAVRDEYRRSLSGVIVQGSSPTLRAAASELGRGLAGLLGAAVPLVPEPTRDGVLVAGTPAGSPLIAALDLGPELRRAGREGFVLRSLPVRGRRATVIAANSDVGVLYGAFHLLRLVQTQQPIGALSLVSAPRLRHRLLNHWDNLDRTRRARLRGLLAVGLAQAPRLPGPALHGLRARQRLDRRQRHRDHERQRQRDQPHLRMAGEGRSARVGLPTLRDPCLPDRSLQRADRDRWAEDSRPARPRGRGVVEAQGRRDLRAHPGLRRLPGEGQLRGPAGPAGLQAQPRRRRERARRRCRSARRHRDVAGLRLLERGRPTTATSRPTTSSSRSTGRSGRTCWCR